MVDVLVDAILDTLKLLPFLFILYILIEILEHRTQIGRPLKALNGRGAPVVGAATGLIPLCGFSVMAAKLYENKYITTGTLIAVFLATNDEALLILLASPMPWTAKGVVIALLCAIKFTVGLGVGYLLDWAMKRRRVPIEKLEQPHHAHGEGAREHGGEQNEFHTCEHKHASNFRFYFLSPLLHALKISLFVFLVNFAGLWFQPLVASAIGMIPNCASSVVIAETYVMGGIAFGTMAAGLLTNAGLGFVVLFRRARAWRENIFLLFITFGIGVAVGYVINAILLCF